MKICGFKGVIFDLDGTLADSKDVWKNVDKTFFGKRGLEIPEDYEASIRGMGFRETAEYTIARCGLSDTPEDVMNEWKSLAHKEYAERVRLKDGAEELLLKLRERKIKLAVATAASRDLCEAVLKNNRVFGYFDAIVYVDEVGRSKASPDIYLEAAKRLKHSPERCAVIEDEPIAADSARSAGFYTVGLDESGQNDAMKNACDRTVTSLFALERERTPVRKRLFLLPLAAFLAFCLFALPLGTTEPIEEFIVFSIFAVPIILTFLNVINLFIERPIRPGVCAAASLVIGMYEYELYSIVMYWANGDYFEAVYPFELHNILNSELALSFELPVLLGGIAIWLLCAVPVRKLPPLVSAFSIAAAVITDILTVIYAVQISAAGFESCLLPYLFFFNVVILSVFGIRKHIREQTARISRDEIKPRRKWTKPLYRLMSKVSGMSAFSFALILPLAALLEIILVLLGQGADGIVKAFTMTADWTFSTQIPPPPIEYEGHYLCTVAAGGHKRLVRPERLGSRRGAVIVVNRQLAAANAFENLIAERTPHFHRLVRGLYDRLGYPVSKYINTPLKADIVYIAFKPLEWLFVAVLYLFDADPEGRIARQYEYKPEHEKNVKLFS